MAANAKSKKKPKGKTVDLNVFLSAGEEPPVGFALVQPKSNINWGDAMENEDLDDRFTLDYKKEEKLVLPTAPKAARGPDFDLSKVPTSPPFTAFLGNLPYDVQDDDIVMFFRQLQVQNVRLPRDTGERGRIRGFGYAEFSSRQDLIQALALNNETMKNRAIKVSLAGDHDGERGGDRRDAGPDRTLGDWRSERKDQFSRDDRNDRDSYQSGRGGFGDRDRDSFRSRNNFDRDSGFNRDRFDRNERNGDRYESRNDYGNRNDRDFGNRDQDRFERRGNEQRGYGFSSDRGSNRGTGRFDRGGGREYNRDGYTSRREESFRDNRYRDSAERDYQPRESYDRRPPPDRSSYDSGGNAQKERRRLQLAPRTKPIEPVPPPAEVIASSSIFGGAKPVDTAAREREIEERLAKEKESGVKDTTKEGVDESRVRKYSSSSAVSNRSRRSSESGPTGASHIDDPAPPYKPPIPRQQERDGHTYNTLPKARQRCSSNSSSTGSDKDNQINSKVSHSQTNRQENYSSNYHTRNDGDSHQNNEDNYSEPARGGYRSARHNNYRDNSRERALHPTTYEQPKPPVYTSANKFSHLMNDADDFDPENNSE